ncbi:hypothetical protein AX15_004493 [Amanita polypyramis BW_CC]|nr:hypothetical protein AX15_004493 [Amanita polypyramis BW_CC]
MFANSSSHRFHLPWYRGELLDMAYDLGERLLPAFSTPTGLPYARINLRHGLTKGETRETCTAGAGSLMLEFATLSRLTRDNRFEKAAHKSFFGLWNRKSTIGLVGNTINTWTGSWTGPEITGIGAGIDSFYEYALKWYILSGDMEFLDVWDDAYTAVMRYSRGWDGFWYRNVNMHNGDVTYNTIDSLSAFWPGLQVLAGDLQNAIKLHLMYYNIWRTHAGLPEVYDTHFKQATSFQYPLRPEFIESTWYLYRATHDPFYLDVGERILHDLIKRAKVECGLTSISDLRNNQRDDRMESFTLSETLKYLFLLFDEDNPLHSDDSNYVFTTEGHILWLDRKYLKPISAARRKMRRVDAHQCPAYFGPARGPKDLVQGIRSLHYLDYARELVGLLPDDTDEGMWSSTGWCERPKLDIFSFDFVLSSTGGIVPEDLSPSLLKLVTLPDGFVINNVTGIRTHIVKRLDGRGYDISKLGHYSVRPGHTVYINDTSLVFMDGDAQDEKKRQTEVRLRFYTENVDLGVAKSPNFRLASNGKVDQEITVNGSPALFGADLTKSARIHHPPIRFSDQAGLPVHRDRNNPHGCRPYGHAYTDSVLFVRRGGCTFLDKLVHAQTASAAGVVVLSMDNSMLNPSAGDDEVEAVGDLSDMALVYLTQDMGKTVSDMLDTAEKYGDRQVMMIVDLGTEPATSNEGKLPEQNKIPTGTDRILYLNGLPLINTRLLV